MGRRLPAVSVPSFVGSPAGFSPGSHDPPGSTAGSSGGQSHPSVLLLPPSPPHILGTDGQAHTRTAGAERKPGHSQLYLKTFS